MFSPAYLTILTFLISCGVNETSGPLIIDPILIDSGNISGAEGISQQNIVITDTNSWNELKSKMDSLSNVTGNFTETEINFSDYLIIAAFSEGRGTGGSSIEIKLIEENSEIINVTIENIISTIGIAVEYQPYYIVKIPKSSKRIIFN